MISDRQNDAEAAAEGRLDLEQALGELRLAAERVDFPTTVERSQLVHAMGRLTSALRDARLEGAHEERVRAELEHAARHERERVGLALAMSELTAILAHDVNQPLAAIVTNANASRRWLAAQPADLLEATAAVQRIAHEGKRASQIVEQVRAQLRSTPARAESILLEETFQDLLGSVRDQVSAAKVSARVSVADSAARVLCDRTQLEHVLLNLTANALEAMNGASELPRRLELSAAPLPQRELCIRVSDSGPGLASDRELAFAAFHSTKPGRLGLGLNIARSLVRSLGGRLWATPNHDGGESFCFTLPLTPFES